MGFPGLPELRARGGAVWVLSAGTQSDARKFLKKLHGRHVVHTMPRPLTINRGDSIGKPHQVLPTIDESLTRGMCGQPDELLYLPAVRMLRVKAECRQIAHQRDGVPRQDRQASQPAGVGAAHIEGMNSGSPKQRPVQSASARTSEQPRAKGFAHDDARRSSGASTSTTPERSAASTSMLSASSRKE